MKRLSFCFSITLALTRLWSMSQEEDSIRSSHHQVLGVGDACLDILVHVSDDLLDRYVPGKKGGSSLTDSYTVQRLLQETCLEPKISPGGSAANTIKGLAGLGLSCGFFTHIGGDDLGEFFVKDLEKKGVESFIRAYPDRHTMQVFSLITPDGQRTMLVLLNDKVTDFVPPKECFHDELSLVLLEGYQLRSSDHLKEMMELAKVSSSKISLDLSSFEVVQSNREAILKLIPEYVDILFANEDEIQALMQRPAAEAILEVQKLCPTVVVMQGKNGCIIVEDEQVVPVPTFPAEVVDTTGAGDLFASGFLYGYLKGYPLRTCARIGNRLGSLIVEVDGVELKESQWQQIYQFLQSESL